MSEKQIVNVSYDFISNDEGEMMLVFEKPDDDFADDENALFIYDGGSSAKLVRKNNQVINIPVIPQQYCDMLKDREILLVTEMDGEDMHDVYEAAINSDIEQDW